MLTTTPKPNRCKHCKVRFPKEEARKRLHDECIEPWTIAFREKQKKKAIAARQRAERADRLETRKKLEAHEPIRKFVARAQVPFNAFIRARDKDKGCFVCGRPFLEGIPGRVQHAGHVRSRGAADHLRFNEDNVHGECEGCNGPHGAKPHQINAGAIARIGQDRYDALEADNDVHKWTREELIEIRKTYAAKRKGLA